MSVAKDCFLSLEKDPDLLPAVAGQSISAEKSLLIDTVPLSGLNYLRDHRVAGKIIYPAAGFAMAGLAVYQALQGSGNTIAPLQLEDIRFRRKLSPCRFGSTILRLEYKPDSSEFAVYSDHRYQFSGSGSAAQHASGKLAASSPKTPVSISDFEILYARCCESVDVNNLYQRLAQSGLNYGPFFRGIVEARISSSTGEAVTRIASHRGLTAIGDPWAQPITLLDSAFQSLAATLDTNNFNLYVPSRIRALRVYSDFEADLWCHAQLTKSSSRVVDGDLTLFNVDRRPILEIKGLRCLKVSLDNVARCHTADDWQQKPAANNSLVNQVSTPLRL
jgi:acyl transferase domain-containing protein